MEITPKEQALINDWIAVHQEIEKLEDELSSLAAKLKKISGKLYDKGSKAELEEFNASLAEAIDNLDSKADKERIKQLKDLKSIVEHDINIENLVEQEIDIEEKGIRIDL